MAEVIFIYKGKQTTIQCLKEEKIKNICNKYTSKIEKDINSLYFLYGGNQINFELTFKEQANNLDKERKVMNVFVYDQDNNELKCPKCGEIINFDDKIFEKLIKLNLNQNDILTKLKSQIENLSDINEINKIKNEIKIINININNIIEENNKSNKDIENNLNNLIINYIEKKNIIEGVINIDNIYEDIILFNEFNENEELEIY